MNRSKKCSGVLFLGIFVLLLLCNSLTPLLVDDFYFHYNSETGERIANFFEIFPALAAHARTANGRLVAHFFVYIFEMLPKEIFNVVNAGMFVLQIYMMYTICKGKPTANNWLLLGIFGSTWVFVPAFGQTNLWLDGSCNYLWSIVCGLLFLLPMINDFVLDRPLPSLFLKSLWVLFGFIAGGYSENGSAPVIFMSILLVLALKLYQKKKIPVYYFLGIGTSMIGYASIFLLSPGELENKNAEMTLYVLRQNFMNALEKYFSLKILLICFVVLLTFAVMLKTEKKRILLAMIFFAGSLCSNFMMTVASYYPDRCMICVTVLLIVANGILLQSVFESDYKPLLVAVLAILFLFSSYYILVGVNDIYETGSKIRANETYILECKERDILNVTVPMVSAKTKYSAANGLRYLSADTPYTWPNKKMAEYYGVETIIGTW